MIYPSNIDKLNLTQHPRTEYGFITIAGDDRFSFLQAVCSADTSPLEKGLVVFSNLLSPQGRIIASFLIIPINNGLWISIKKNLIEKIFKQLKKLAISKNVHIKTNLNMNTFFSNENPQAIKLYGKVYRKENIVFFADPRHKKLMTRIITPESQDKITNLLPQKNIMSYSSYLWNCYSIGLVENGESLLEKPLLPVEANHSKWKAINFEKGCFPGQEVNIRMSHRKTIKKIIYGAYSQEKIVNNIPNLSNYTHEMLNFQVITSLIKNQMWAGLILVRAIKGNIAQHQIPQKIILNGNYIKLT